MLERFFTYVLTALARATLYLHRPTVIAITGSVGKTTTKDLLGAALREASIDVRGNEASYNSDLGVPLTILGAPSGFRNPLRWLWTLVRSCVTLVFGTPRYIVTEVGTDRPNDIRDIARWLRPNVAILLSLPNTPVHVENFSSVAELHEEKVSLLDAVPAGGAAVYNDADSAQRTYAADRPHWQPMSKFASLVSYGVHAGADGRPLGLDVVLNIEGREEPFYVPETVSVGAAHALVAATAAAVVIGGVSIPNVRKAVASREPTPGRGRILRGVNGSVIIDDSYNASPVALEGALRQLAVITSSKRVAVLGAMAELGEFTKPAHERIGTLAAEVADVVLVVGDAPYEVGERVTHEEAAERCRALAEEGTVFLFKGSQSSRVERVVREVLDPSIDPATCMVRQSPRWLATP